MPRSHEVSNFSEIIKTENHSEEQKPYQQPLDLSDRNPSAVKMLISQWNSKKDDNSPDLKIESPTTVTLYASSEYDLRNNIDRINQLLSIYEEEIKQHNAMIINTEKSDEDSHSDWIKHITTHPSNRRYKKPFFFNHGLKPQ